MSDEGRAFVKLHSPYTGNTWWFHYVLGDIANAPNDYRIYVKDETLAKEWPLSRSACTRARAQLLADGYLEPLSGTTAPNRPREYRFTFLGAEHMAYPLGGGQSNAPRGDARSKSNTRQGDARTRGTTKRVRASNRQGDLLPTESEPKENLAAVPRATDDPIKEHARRLAVIAHEQRVKPVTRGGFPTVMSRIEAELRAGTTVQAIRKAIEAGDVTWTADGLRTAISKASPRARPRTNAVGGDATLPELLQQAADAEARDRRSS